MGGGRRPAVREERNIRRGAKEQSISHRGWRRKRGGGRSSGERIRNGRDALANDPRRFLSRHSLTVAAVI